MRKYLIPVLLGSLIIACSAAKKANTAQRAPHATEASLPHTKENQSPTMKGPDTAITGSGLRYVIYKHSARTKRANSGDKVSVHYIGRLEDGSEFDNSYSRGEPFEFQLGMGKVIPGWEEGIALLSVGDSALLVIPPALGYGSRARTGIPANSTLYFEVELMSAKEPVFANEYQWQNKPEHKTASGLTYYIVKEGTGKQAYSGADVKVHYTGYLKDGKIFDSSVLREEPLEFKLGVGMVIRGWDEGILLMRQGSKYRFIIPSTLGYGDQDMGSGVIPANSQLTFDCELVEVK